MPDEALKHADVVMTGFSEFTFPQMIMDFKLKQLKRLYVQGNDFPWQESHCQEEIY